MLKKITNSRFFRSTMLVPLLLGLAGVAFTALVFMQARDAAVSRYHLQFERDASLRANLVERALEVRLLALRALSRLVNENTDSRGFSELTSAFGDQMRGVQAFGWAPRVRRGERSPVVITQRSPDGRLVPAGEREEYFPLLFVQPRQGNEEAVGFDLGSEPVRRAALERARANGAPAASGRIALVQDPARRNGFLLVAPVPGRDGVAGFVTASICFEELFRVALEDTPVMGLPFTLDDVTSGSPPGELERWSARLEGARSWKRWLCAPAPGYSGRLSVAGREWAIRIDPNSAYAERHFSLTHWLLLPPGLLLSLFLPLFLRAALMRREELLALVDKRTRELRESEERFRLIFDSTNDGIVVIRSEDGGILLANRRAEEIGGWSPGELGKAGLADLVGEAPPWSMAEAREWIRRALEEGPQLFEWRGRFKTGDRTWVEIALQGITLGGKGCLLATARDIDQRKRLEAEVSRAQKLEAVSALARGVGHDVNNLLTSLRGNLSLARMIEEAGTGPVADKLAAADEACVHIKELVERLMVFSRESRVEKTPCALPSLVQEAARAGLEGGRARMLFEPDPGLWEVMAEKPLLLQALRAIFENAREAMPQGGEIEVSATNLVIGAENRHPLVPRGEYVALAVHDHGPGIPEASLGRMFDMYYSTKPTPAVKGLGLSLAMVYAIVTRQGGFISVESPAGEGAVFTLFLPRLAQGER